MHRYRTHSCNELRPAQVGETVRLSGWVHRKRDHGNLLFLDMRDHYGITQCVVDTSHADFAAVEAVRPESVVTVTGKVVARTEDTVNAKLPTGEVEISIASQLAPFIEPGATLQTGIGGVPNAVVELLANGSGGDYGIHSEMFTTGLMRLHEAGKVSNRKGIFDGMSITTFAMGSRELYDWLDGNEAVRFLPVDVVNDPAVIAGNRGMISINGALSIDLFGQIVADSISGVQHSGIGGHEDFLAGAGRVAAGRSLICLPSMARVNETNQSRIVASLEPGSLVTSPRHQVDVVVSEFGAAELAGRTVGERAYALAEIAHPDVRDELRAAAAEIDRRGVLA